MGSMVRRIWVAGLVFGLCPAIAPASSVYLNGVKIDGLTNQKLEKVNVKIDEKGDLYIDAPGYQVKVSGSSSTPLESKISKKYWLVTEQSSVGATDFDIDVYVNSKWIRKLRGSEEPVITEITRYLSPGKNAVLLSAHKIVAAESRRSNSPQDTFRVVVGEGNVGGDQVMIDNPIIDFRRNASEAGDVSQEFSVTAR